MPTAPAKPARAPKVESLLKISGDKHNSFKASRRTAIRTKVKTPQPAPLFFQGSCYGSLNFGF